MGVLAQIFGFSGTATRLQALIAALIYGICAVALQLCISYAPLQARFLFPIAALSMMGLFATMARRLHHAGYSGRWAALVLVPIAGLFAMAAITLLSQKRAHLRAHNGARLAGYLGMLLIALFALWRIGWAPYWIPSESMKPTLMEGDYIVAAQGGVSADDIHRGQVVVFRHPVTGQDIVKRVVGVAGDSVAVVAGQVIVNGAALLQLPFGTLDEVMGPKGPAQTRPRCGNGAVGDGAMCSKTILHEMLAGGQQYAIANIEDGGFSDNFGSVTVPAGMLFLLGDNRDNSLDSRFAQAAGGLGFVPVANVVGQAKRVLFSSAGASLLAVWTWRMDRLFKAVE